MQGSDVERVCEALLSAFPSRSALAQVVRFRLDVKLDEIAGAGGLRETVFELVRLAEAKGWLLDLIAAAQKECPKSAELRALNPRDRSPGDEGRDRTIARVERVARLRDPNATITRRVAPEPFAGLLEVEVVEGPIVDVRVVGVIDRAVDEEVVSQFVGTVELPYRRENPRLSSTLIHGGEGAPVELARSAWKSGVLLKTLAEYQGLIDFSRYLDWQTGMLEVDKVYPPWLYVDQPAKWSLAQGREEQGTEHALRTLWELLESPHPRFALVLGDFGAGKTFLLHELARRMAKEKHPLTPVLVEMSMLEKQRDLKVLLAQHFARADMGRFDPNAFMYMLSEGRIALLFDGFDELALRLTYDRALEHFETVMAAAQGNAKVVVTSRTQHFLTNHQVRLELGKRAEQVTGFRLVSLERFGEKQIRRFLGNLIEDAKEAEDRYALLHDVRDLLGLSENPRMLGFIAKIDPEKLKAAKAGGEITAAKLYEILIGQWLDFEYKRANPSGAPKGVTREKMGELVAGLAGLFWERNAKWMVVGDFSGVLVAEGIEPAIVEHMIGSGSLLVRDAEGRFSFVHRSVMEWLVAKEAARGLEEKGEAGALGVDEMSELMADFLISLAGPRRAEQWAWEKAMRVGDGHAKKNAARVLRRIELIAGGAAAVEIPVTMDLDGEDLRGQDWSRVDWQGASLVRANLEGATLRDADLRGASLEEAKLGRADLEKANLSGADMRGTDLGFARLMGADLRDARGLSAGLLRGAKLVGAQGVEVGGLIEVGAAPAAPREILPMIAPASQCHPVAWSKAGDLLASGHNDGTIRIWDVTTGRTICVLQGHTMGVESLAFSPDDLTLASGSSDTTVRLWDVATARMVRAYEGHTDWVVSVAFSPDGLTLASGAYDKIVRLWDVASAGLVRAYEGHTGWVQSVAFSPDGLTLASASTDTTVRLWDVATARLVRAYRRQRVGSRASLSARRPHLASASAIDCTAWDVAPHAWFAFMGANGVQSVAFSPDRPHPRLGLRGLDREAVGQSPQRA
ncbi:MAG: pentapeptide repeat-containing protein [Byssovorax sp.]